MRQTLQNQDRLFGVDEALEEIKRRHPAMTEIATAFALIQKARLAAHETLPQEPILGAGLDETLALDLLASGQPLLADLMDALALPGPELAARFCSAARHVLPAAAQAFPALAADLAQIAHRLELPGDAPDQGEALASTLLSAIGPDKPGTEAAPSIEAIAARLELPVPALHMAATESFLAVLAHEAALLAPLAGKDSTWRQGYCPVCGGGPDVAILKEGREDSEFLIAKAGQLWFHCSQCATLWRFPRLRCVACGCEDPHSMETLEIEGDTRAEQERVHLCQECKTYFTTVNLVDRTDRINLEMLPMTLLHLELLAQERGFAPIAPTPWNSLG